MRVSGLQNTQVKDLKSKVATHRMAIISAPHLSTPGLPVQNGESVSDKKFSQSLNA